MQALNLNIKEEYKSTIVGYNNSGLPLGERGDLHLLAEMAYQNPQFKPYFEDLPSLEDIEQYKADLFLQNNPPVEVDTPVAVVEPTKDPVVVTNPDAE